MLFFGIDPSITSTAIVAVRTDDVGERVLNRRWYGRFKTKAGYLAAKKRPRVHDISILEANPFTLQPDDHVAFVGQQIGKVNHQDRFDRYRDNILGVIRFMQSCQLECASDEPTYIAIEDYAIKAKGRVYDIGEYGGLLRDTILREVPHSGFREHDPLSLKLFGAEMGNADKDAMVKAYTDKFLENADWLDWSWITEAGSILTDLVDAHFLAELMRVEARLRHGYVNLHQLKEGRQIEIFNRVTKSYPTNVLGRPFLGQKDFK